MKNLEENLIDSNDPSNYNNLPPHLSANSNDLFIHSKERLISSFQPHLSFLSRPIEFNIFGTQFYVQIFSQPFKISLNL
jgi:hypothetical protein